MNNETRLTSPKEVRGLLAQLGHRPNKGLGQNYLIDANILDIIADTAGIGPDENVLEIGPGLGALTERIIPKARSVTCIEKDPTMAKYLRSRFSDFSLIEEDALDVDMDALFAGGITKVAANLPYSVASRLMVDIAECAHRPEIMSLTIQKEVADRLTAPSGDKHYGMLGILTGVYYRNTLVKKISPTCFLPPPKVWSAVVKMERRDVPVVDEAVYPTFKTLVKHCFSQRRKQVGTILKHMGISPVDELLAEAGIEHAERPEVIEIERWASLARLLV
ncbi:MAG: ribosomal RNA small subunit methyltransferase A [Pontiellaceae bacterium]|nr:ribosomal RNA small subunit methyltransferase A [Pontiellaceae bacterium]MBN2785348.1 ribosomal RNA small subunit methyltransferase A [Pontiellaceae bacterium]